VLIPRAKLLPHLRIASLPEAPQIVRDLHGPSRRREELERDGHPGATDARAVGEAEQFLQLDGRRDATAVAIFEWNRAATGHGDDRRCMRKRRGVLDTPGVDSDSRVFPIDADRTRSSKVTSTPANVRRRNSARSLSPGPRRRYWSATMAEASLGSGAIGCSDNLMAPYSSTRMARTAPAASSKS
jgi:hypothetical protein